MTFIARKLTNTIEFFIADSRSTGEMWTHNSAGEKSLFFAHIFAKNNQRHLLRKKQLFCMSRNSYDKITSKQWNVRWLFLRKIRNVYNAANCEKWGKPYVQICANCRISTYLIAIKLHDCSQFFRRLAKGPKASLWLPQWFYCYLLRQIDKTEECF